MTDADKLRAIQALFAPGDEDPSWVGPEHVEGQMATFRRRADEAEARAAQLEQVVRERMQIAADALLKLTQPVQVGTGEAPPAPAVADVSGHRVILPAPNLSAPQGQVRTVRATS